MKVKQFSAISEEKSLDELQPWVKKAEEMEIIQSILGADEGNFTVTEEPSETTLGSFHVRVAPNCGMEIAGCFIELEMTYLDLDSTELHFEILPDRAEGLTDEQLEELQYEISQNRCEGASTIEVISHI